MFCPVIMYFSVIHLIIILLRKSELLALLFAFCSILFFVEFHQLFCDNHLYGVFPMSSIILLDFCTVLIIYKQYECFCGILHLKTSSVGYVSTFNVQLGNSFLMNHVDIFSSQQLKQVYDIGLYGAII